MLEQSDGSSLSPSLSLPIYFSPFDYLGGKTVGCKAPNLGGTCDIHEFALVEEPGIGQLYLLNECERLNVAHLDVSWKNCNDVRIGVA